MGFIYKICNDFNDKVYVGQTVRKVSWRWQDHKHRAECQFQFKSHIYNAMRKYGIEHFYCETIEECPDIILDDRERYWIKYYDSYNHGYNDTLGGQDRKRFFLYEDISKDLCDGMTKQEVAEKYHCDKKTVYNACVSTLGINPTQVSNKIFDKEIYELYVNQNKNIKQIIDYYDEKYHRAKIVNSLKRMGLK